MECIGVFIWGFVVFVVSLYIIYLNIISLIRNDLNDKVNKKINDLVELNNKLLKERNEQIENMIKDRNIHILKNIEYRNKKILDLIQ